MPTFDDFPYRAATTLAIDLIKEHPSLDEAAAIDIAWHAYKEDDKATFRAAQYSDEVRRAISRIRSDSRTRVETPLRLLQKARERVGLKQATSEGASAQPRPASQRWHGESREGHPRVRGEKNPRRLQVFLI